MRKGDFGVAETLLDELLASEVAGDADRAFLLNKRGVARMGAGRHEEARADFHAALEFGPFAPALTNLGNLALESGDLDGAIAHYEAALKADDEYFNAHWSLGVAYKRAGRIDDGVRELRRAQKLEGRALDRQKRTRT